MSFMSYGDANIECALDSFSHGEVSKTVDRNSIVCALRESTCEAMCRNSRWISFLVLQCWRQELVRVRGNSLKISNIGFQYHYSKSRSVFKISIQDRHSNIGYNYQPNASTPKNVRTPGAEMKFNDKFNSGK